jgi:hypothetical protein
MPEYVDRLKKIDWENEDTAHLSTEFQSAMENGAQDMTVVHVSRSRRGLAFHARVELPKWARQHVDAMNAEAENSMVEGGTGASLPVGTPIGQNSPDLVSKRAMLKKLLDEILNSEE